VLLLQSATKRQPHARGWPRSGLSHLTWSETYHALDHLLSGVAPHTTHKASSCQEKSEGMMEKLYN
jgi:hypothetical protein